MDMTIQDSFLTVNRIFKIIHESDFLKKEVLFQVLHLILYFNHSIASTDLVPEDLGKLTEHFTDLILPVFYGKPMDGIQGIIDEMRIDLGFEGPDLRVFFHFTYLLDLVHLIIDLFHHLIKLIGYDGYFIFAFHLHMGGHFPGPYLLHGVYNLLNRSRQPSGQDPYEESTQYHQTNGYHPYDLLEISDFLQYVVIIQNTGQAPGCLWNIHQHHCFFLMVIFYQMHIPAVSQNQLFPSVHISNIRAYPGLVIMRNDPVVPVHDKIIIRIPVRCDLSLLAYI